MCTHCYEKKDPYCTRITMGGNLVNYSDDCVTPTADLLMVKLMLNSVISTLNAKFMTIDLKDFYLLTPMSRYEYLLIALSTLASAQAAPTEYTMSLIKWLLGYDATQPNAILTYKKSDMILAVHSNASYLSKARARSQVGGHFFCSKDCKNPSNNGAVHTVSKILKAVMSSAAEAELGAIYINPRKAVLMRQLLEEMGHKQPKTPIIQSCQQQHPIATYKSHGHAIPLVMLSRITKINSNTIGGPEPTTELTTIQSIAALLITLRSARKSSLQTSYSAPYARFLTEHLQHWAKALSKQPRLPLLHDLT